MVEWPIEGSAKLPTQGKHVARWGNYLRIVVNASNQVQIHIILL